MRLLSALLEWKLSEIEALDIMRNHLESPLQQRLIIFPVLTKRRLREYTIRLGEEASRYRHVGRLFAAAICK